MRRGRPSAPRRVAAIAVVTLVALATPAVLVANGLRVAATGAFVGFAYDRATFPADRYGGLPDGHRLRLARLGLESIRPGSEGIVLLEPAQLPSGDPAFNRRELTHMDDVRTVFGNALLVQLALLAGIALLALVLAPSALRGAVPRGLLAGALLTLGVAIAAAVLILVGFDGLFLRFHEVFFEGETWRFPVTDTLIRIYPEAFWVTTAQAIAAVTLAQAVILAIAGALIRRRIHHRARPVHAAPWRHPNRRRSFRPR